MTEPYDSMRIFDEARHLITNPAHYYQHMSKTGGFARPLIFVVVMAAVMGLITALLSFFESPVGMLTVGLAAIVIVPFAAAIGSFIGAAIIFVIWKLMGSTQTYETAYRCLAAATAIYPIIGVFTVIPYVGSILAVFWGCYLMIVASVIVHKRDPKLAAVVFGILALITATSNISSEYASRQIAHGVAETGKVHAQ